MIPTSLPRNRSLKKSAVNAATRFFGLLSLYHVVGLCCGPFAQAATESGEIVELSPFVVSSDADEGYAADSTLAANRLNTRLSDTAAAISVFTGEFIQDIGAVNLEDALDYALNGGREFSDFTGLLVQQNDLKIQMRGFVGASIGRDYFPTNINTDVYNTERIDFSRGPNSILFGVGGPGGIINVSTKRPRYESSTNEIGIRFGSWSDLRATVDFNRPLGDKAALRINAFWQDRDGWRDFERYEGTGIAGSIRLRPWKNTEIRVQGEIGERDQVVAGPWPTFDFSSEWLGAGSPIAAENNEPVAGTQIWGAPIYIFEPTTGVADWNQTLRTSRAAGTPSNPSISRSFTDFSVIPRSINLMGPGSTTDNDHTVVGVFLEQYLGPVSIQLAYNRNEENRYVRFPLLWNEEGIHADANPFLPSGAPNPNVGKFYVQSWAITRDIFTIEDNYRATIAYNIDLRDINAWLGNHRFAGLVSRSESFLDTDSLNEVNRTPAGDGTYPARLNHPFNRLYRRTYIDPHSRDLADRGAQDPWSNPVVDTATGVTSAFARINNSHLVSQTNTDSFMIGGQSVFWEDQLSFTYGFRRDEQEILGRTGATRDPVTFEWSKNVLADSGSEFSGNTRTFGIVFHATDWASLFYNNANNFIPQSFLTIESEPIGPSRGKGEDMGAKFSFFKGRVRASIARYETDQVNAFTNGLLEARTVIAPTSNLIWDALGMPENEVITTFRPARGAAGKGWEVEASTNLTSGWKLLANFSDADLVESGTLPHVTEYIEENRGLWQNNADVVIGPNNLVSGENPTVGDAIAHIDTVYAALKQSEGQAPRLHQKQSLNIFSSYEFSSGPGWIEGMTIGAGANYRSEPVTGYHTVTDAPVYGRKTVVYNVLIAREFEISERFQVRLQLNIDNVLDDDELIIWDKDDLGTHRYRFQMPRRWSLSSTVRF